MGTDRQVDQPAGQSQQAIVLGADKWQVGSTAPGSLSLAVLSRCKSCRRSRK